MSRFALELYLAWLDRLVFHQEKSLTQYKSDAFSGASPKQDRSSSSITIFCGQHEDGTLFGADRVAFVRFIPNINIWNQRIIL